MNPSTQTATATHSACGSIFNAGPVARSIAGLLCCAAVALSTSGCATTRFGALIPGHTRSEKIKGELVTAQYICITPDSSGEQPLHPKTGRAPASLVEPVSTAQLASLLAGVAVDTVKQELIREAKRYEHQSSARLMLTTSDLGAEGLIVVTRWIDGEKEPRNTNDGKEAASKGSNATQRSGVFPSNRDQPIPSELTGKFVPQTVDVKFNEVTTLGDLIAPRNGKRPAEVLTLRVKREGSSSVYRIAGGKLWVGAVGAKVVKFGWGNLPQFWQWPGALLLKSDSQVEIEATANIKSLMATKDSELKWTEVKPESGILSSIEVNLNEVPKTYELTNNVGAWLAVPMVKTTKNSDEEMGFVIMDFKLNERDTSNASKYLEDAAKAVEKNRGSIVDGVTKVFE